MTYKFTSPIPGPPVRSERPAVLLAALRQERPGDHPRLPAGPRRGDRGRGAGGQHEAEVRLRGILLRERQQMGGHAREVPSVQVRLLLLETNLLED